MNIVILQMRIAFAAPERNRAHLVRLMEQAAALAPDIVLLPELWDTGFYPTPIRRYADPDGEAAHRLLAGLARRYRVNIVGGSVAVQSGERTYNTCYVHDRTGALVARYRKAHLFSPMGEQESFTPGDAIALFSLDGVRCALAICYDLRFPEFIRRLALSGIDLLLLPAAWPGARLSHWRTLTAARAIENQIFVAAANGAGAFENGMELAGHSAVLDPWGTVLAEANEQECLLPARLDLAELHRIRTAINVYADRREELYGSP